LVTETVYLSLGSNLGDRAVNLREATRRLGQLGTIRWQSSLYETEPIEVQSAQPWFLNCAVALATQLTPRELLEAALTIEREMGRQRTGSKQPRQIDIDILLFGERVIRDRGLTVPHPAMQQRRFVLEPMMEIAPEAQHPILKKSVRELWEALPAGASVVRKLV
jgi:2-amino-4-hydroxy-6-hydroxymethyldihydropteridine diphosphokinase